MKFLALTPLTIDLLPAALDLDQRCLGGLWTLEGYQREIDSPNSDLWILQSKNADSASADSASADSASADREILGLGCLWAILEEAHITVLGIDPSHQRQGLGQALLYQLLASANRRGLEWATLEVRASNQAAVSLYQKFSFQAVGKRRSYYQDNGEDALILWCRGLQQPEFEQKLQVWHEEVSKRLRQSGWEWHPPVTISTKP
ncbi:MAG: ribosomal protein S18-alanine N-acetyltransferase [Leptolyngbyaceae cyanobacterium CRU_2_3]|nr:ribosomal protein S18-alanine N-acetyltransferase [Leptolyngbyaceae cyanobacterium CRU_2_3]